MLNEDNKPYLSRNLKNQPIGAIFLCTPFLGFVRCYTDEAKAEKALAIAEERYEKGMGINLDLLPSEDLGLAWYGAKA